MKESILYDKAIEFCTMIVPICSSIQQVHREFDLTRQLIRASASISANLSEASGAESTRDFLHKLTISRKEINESVTFLEILKRTHYIDIETHEKLNSYAVAIQKMLNASIRTVRSKLNKS